MPEEENKQQQCQQDHQEEEIRIPELLVQVLGTRDNNRINADVEMEDPAAWTQQWRRRGSIRPIKTQRRQALWNKVSTVIEDTGKMVN